MAIISNATTIADAGSFSVGLGAMTLIKTITASNSSTISFVHGSSSVVLNNTYPIYMFKFLNLHCQTDDSDLMVSFSKDAGSNYNRTITSTFFQAYNTPGATTGQLGYLGTKDSGSSTTTVPLEHSVGNANDESCSGHMFLYNPSGSVHMKNFTSRIAIKHHSQGNSQDCFSAGYIRESEDIDAVRFNKNQGNIDSGVIKLYGIKDS